MIAPEHNHDYMPGRLNLASKMQPDWLKVILRQQEYKRVAFMKACDKYESGPEMWQDAKAYGRNLYNMKACKQDSEAADQKADFARAYWERLQNTPGMVCECPPQLWLAYDSGDQYFDPLSGSVVENVITTYVCPVCGAEKGMY